MALLSPNFVFAFREMPLVWKSCIFNVSIHIVLILTHSWFISDVWFHSMNHTYILSLLHLRRNVDKCRGCFDSIEHQFPSGRCPVCPDHSPVPGPDTWRGHVTSPHWRHVTRGQIPDQILTVSSHHRGSVYLFCIMMQNFQFCINERLWSLIQWELILYEEYLIFEDYLCESQETLF